MVETIHSSDDLLERILEYGLLPLFDCGVRGFSASEMTPGGLWFSDGEDGLGLWGWKAPVIRSRRCTYGQFFGRKMGFVSLECLPDFLNWRRSRSVARNEDKAEMEEAVLQVVEVSGAATKAEIRQGLGFDYKRRSAGDPIDRRTVRRLSLDPLLSDLQMGGRLVISDITRRVYGNGEEDRYGWQIAHYSTPEEVFGRDGLRTDLTPEESHGRLLERLASLLPGADMARLRKLL